MNTEQFPDVVMPECPAEKISEGQKAMVKRLPSDHWTVALNR
jgi:hypothetical protein